MAALLWIAMFVVGLAGSRRRREYRFVVLGAVVGFAIQAVLAAPSLGDLRPSIFVLLLGLSVAAFVLDLVVGATADKRRVQDRRRAWDFDHALYQELQSIREGIASLLTNDRTDSDQVRRLATIQASRDALERVRRLPAPNPDWDALKLDYIEIFSAVLKGIQTDDPPDNPALDRRRDAADERWVALRQSYAGPEPR